MTRAESLKGNRPNINNPLLYGECKAFKGIGLIP